MYLVNNQQLKLQKKKVVRSNKALPFEELYQELRRFIHSSAYSPLFPFPERGALPAGVYDLFADPLQGPL